MSDAEPDPAGSSERERARKRVVARRNLQGGVVAWVVTSAFLTGIWAFTGRGYFWPGWIIGLWGLAMVLGVWAYFWGPVTEADVDAELRRTRR